MIQIKMKGSSALEGIAHMHAEFPMDRKAIWIGRGEDVGEKQSMENYSINLGNLSKAISRLHACIILSPSFFRNNNQSYPTYFERFSGHWESLTPTLLDQIWQYAKPIKRILLKDLQSKAGIFRKLTSSPIQAGTIGPNQECNQCQAIADP